MSAEQLAQTRQSIIFMCLLTLKSLILAMVLGYGLLYAVLAIRPAEAATLRNSVAVNEDVIRLSDLFDDLPSGTDAVLGSAPAIGKDIVLNSTTLNRVANAYNLSWKPENTATQIVVRRSVVTIKPDQIQDSIKSALNSRGVSGDFAVSLNDLSNAPIVLPGNLPATVEVARLSYTPGHDTFSATIAAPSVNNPVKTIVVNGQIDRTTKVPVLKTSMKNGDIIGSTDVIWVDVAQRDMPNDAVLDADSLIGKTPIRLITAGSPVHDRELVMPQMVSRGDEVVIVFNAGSLELSTKGKAMQNGAEGDIIRVLNVSSNKSLNAEITGDRIVRVN